MIDSLTIKDLPAGRSHFVDSHLESLIKGVEKVEKDENLPEDAKFIDIVLTVSGTLVMGELISYDTWFNEVILREKGETNEEEQDASSSADPESSEDLPTERRYIHLRN